MKTTPAQAFVDFVAKEIGGGTSYWRVTVSTAPGWPAPAKRIYTIKAYTDTMAAQEGLRRFSEELDAPPISVH